MVSLQSNQGSLYYVAGNATQYSTLYWREEDRKTEIDTANEFCITDQAIYYLKPNVIPPTAPDVFALYRCDLDGSNKTKITDIPDFQLALGMADDGIYLFDMNDHLWRLNLDDAGIEKIS